MTRAALIAFAIAVMPAAPGVAQSVAPSATTATYGNWTVTCGMAAVVGTATPQKLCQMTTKLNLKGNDGQLRPLLEVAIGLPPGGTVPRIVLQVPIDVTLRAPVVVSVDAEAAGEPKPQTDLVTATYFACTPAGCIADAELTTTASVALMDAKITNVTFTALTGTKKITVPVEMTGYVDAWNALGMPVP